MADGKVVISTALDNSGIEKDAGKMKGSIANAAKSIKGSLGGLTKVVAGVTASITAAFGAAAIAITKQAVDAYADYEQLIGGVEKLFKDAADKVAAYAENAFYTVGISANEYMETVTSFSASLISSLAGDTAKAADVANMALTDMADNANKMGTPLESIKTAYQGFAKQNYTMLDNLKLGYGGTKTEMERLLADAQKLTGVKYNISNLADVYNAIHAIQAEMGIAGTTAKEAEKTITGSANMTKAAWKNVLTAIAGGGDLDRAINNLVYSVSKYFDNLVPVVERSLAGIGQLIERVAPQLVETVAAALIKAIPSLLNAVYQMIIGLANGIYQGIVALLSGSTKEVEAQLNATDDLADGYNSAADGAENLAEATTEAGKAAKKSLAPFDEITRLNGKDSSEEAGGSVIGGATSGGSVTLDGEVKDALSPKIESIIRSVVERIKGLAEDIKEAFAPSIQAWSRAFENVIPAVQDTADRIGQSLGELIENDLKPMAEYVAGEWVPSIVNTFNETFAPVFADVMPVLLEEAAADFEYFCSASSTALDGLKGVMQDTEKAFKDMCNSFSKNWSKYGGDILKNFKGFKNSLRELFDSLYSKIIEPLLEVTGDSIDGFWNNHLKPLWDSLVEAIMSIGSNLMALWNDILWPIIDLIISVFGPAVSAIWNMLCDAFEVGVGALADLISGLMTLLDGVLQFVVGVFSLNWKKAWEGIVKVFKGLWDMIVGTVKYAVNLIIFVINALVSAIYAVIAGVVNGVGDVVSMFGDLLGKDWGFSIPTNPPQIPYLAKGAVLPPNKPFMAVVGDQKHGTNIEAPLETIQEAVAIVMEDMVQSNIAGHEATVAVLREILEAVLGIHIGDDVIGQAVARYNAKMAVIRGGA